MLFCNYYYYWILKNQQFLSHMHVFNQTCIENRERPPKSSFVKKNIGFRVLDISFRQLLAFLNAPRNKENRLIRIREFTHHFRWTCGRGWQR